jgi:lipopolysaccharide export system ATP-binding protein
MAAEHSLMKRAAALEKASTTETAKTQAGRAAAKPAAQPCPAPKPAPVPAATVPIRPPAAKPAAQPSPAPKPVPVPAAAVPIRSPAAKPAAGLLARVAAQQAAANIQNIAPRPPAAPPNAPAKSPSADSPFVFAAPPPGVPLTGFKKGPQAILSEITDGPLTERPIPPDRHTLGVTNLRKKFGRKEVVRGVNFSMYNGEVAGLLGPNGAGKTTIFYMIVGFYRPTSGIVTMDNVDITSKPMYRRARQGVAYLPQEASIFRKLTVEQNIWAILESRRDINKPAKKEKLESLLEEFGIGRIRSQFGFTLSGGERRRTEIARALATEPKFLLLDEPFAGIDPIAVYEIKQIIRRLADKGIGILITDHNVRDTLEITTEAFIIADGTIVARGDRDMILADKMVREVYLGSEFRM